MKKIRQIADTDFIFIIMILGGFVGATAGILAGYYFAEYVGVENPDGPMLLGTIAGIALGGGLPGRYLPTNND